MIRLVTGPLGTGKSYYGVRMAVRALQEGRMVATNFDMAPDWTDRVARRGRLFKNSERCNARAERYADRYFRIRNMDDLRRLRVRPEAPFAAKNKYGQWVVKEGQLVVILDEAHRWMNARSWSKGGREDLLEFFALARKLGMVIYLIAQRAENLDVQVRELFEDHIRLNNLRRSARAFGFRVIPFNFFIAGWRNHAYPGEVIRTERYRLGWERRLYDTMDTGAFQYHGEPGEEETLWLPHSPSTEDRTDAAGGGSEAPPPAPAGPPPPASAEAMPSDPALPVGDVDPSAAGS